MHGHLICIMFQAQIDNYLGREPVSVESLVVESIKSDVLQVSTPSPQPPYCHFIPESSLTNIYRKCLLFEIFLVHSLIVTGCNQAWALHPSQLLCVLQKLKQLGPLKEEDQRLVVNLSQEGRRLVMDKKGMINFLKVPILCYGIMLWIYIFDRSNFNLMFRMMRDLDRTLTTYVWREKLKGLNSCMRMRMRWKLLKGYKRLD